ncbi:MAG: 4-alpha-glucanotransferase [Clostridia bacterium]|nr:4-alpha-glucanotransferase [Clostridia bacterium]
MKRSAGVLLSVTSLSSKYGIGCFSKAAYDFVDFLAEAGQTYWQILPLGPTSYGPSGDSPYQAYSAFAGNPYLISLEALIEEGVLTQEECDAVDFGDRADDVDYDKLHAGRYQLLRRAYERSDISRNQDYQWFVGEHGWWLHDYALFMAVKNYFGDISWTEWPEDIRRRWGFALDYYRRMLYFDIEFQMYMQFKFFTQWHKLKNYANEKRIQIVGDMPIYVSMNSADVWAHPELFQMDENNVPSAVAGCPPDSFSATGQIWGNPLYRWDYHAETGFAWWISRLYSSFKLYDVVRIDHFRGFDEYFSIPTGSDSALDGHWEKGPGIYLFWKMWESIGMMPVIAEDLGYMTDSVRRLVEDSGFPNMKVLQFGFDLNDTGAVNDYLPHNYHENCVAYTGTHDNETIAGWFAGLSAAEKELVRDYLCNHDTEDEKMWKALTCAALMSRAKTCIIPIQDYIGMDNECRMNKPSTVGMNWRWRLQEEYLTDALCGEMRALTTRYGRMNWAAADVIEAEKKAAADAAAMQEAADEGEKA